MKKVFIIIAAICGFVMPDTTMYLFMGDATFFAIGLFMAFMHMELEHENPNDDKDKL